MPVLPAMRQREPRRIAEAVRRAVHHLRQGVHDESMCDESAPHSAMQQCQSTS
jgi:hypothetical protein